MIKTLIKKGFIFCTEMSCCNNLLLFTFRFSVQKGVQDSELSDLIRGYLAAITYAAGERRNVKK